MNREDTEGDAPEDQARPDVSDSESSLWLDPSGRLSVRRRDDGSVVVALDGTSILLSGDTCGDLADVLAPAPARATAAVAAAAMPASPAVADGDSFYQVYYVHEYRDGDGAIVPCPALDDDPDTDTSEGEWRYTWNAANAAAVLARVAWLGELIHSLDEARAEEELPRDGENARAWVSLYRMPADERIWKGFWDDLDEAAL